MAEKLSREQLYELVWSASVVKVASSLGVSDVALAKRCRRAQVPLPPRGYWAKVSAGYSVAKVPLPEFKAVAAREKQRPKKQPDAKPQREIEKELPSRRDRFANRLPKGDRLELFWCKIDGWKRNYRFGINWRPSEYNTKSWEEHDCLELLTSIRSSSDRPYRNLRIVFFPLGVARESLHRELDSIGSVWTDRQQKGWLNCAAHLPDDAYHSVCNAVGRGEFKEILVTLRNLRRGQGDTSEVSLRAEITDLSSDE